MGTLLRPPHRSSHPSARSKRLASPGGRDGGRSASVGTQRPSRSTLSAWRCAGSALSNLPKTCASRVGEGARPTPGSESSRHGCSEGQSGGEARRARTRARRTPQPAATLLRQSALDAARAHALSRTRPATVNMELFNAGGSRAIGGRAPTVAPKRRSKSPRRAAADAAADATAATAAAPAPPAAASSPVASRASPIDGIDGVGVAGGSDVDERRVAGAGVVRVGGGGGGGGGGGRRSDSLGRCRHGLRPPGRRHGGGGGERGDGRRAAAFGAATAAARR